MVSDDDDAEEAGTPSKRTEDSFDFGSEKKSKKKKKSTSKSKSTSIHPSSSSASSSSSAAYSKASQLFTNLTSGLRSSRLASSTSPKSLLSRVLILVVFSLVLIGSFVYYQQVLEAEEMRLLEEARIRAQSRNLEWTMR
ncbi:hypothetical protein BASA81_006644 [Batrachochytrium salamandrivorans]|nr:hypothetical protein BASA81_006644 [Batrachochytrium salamandrivorans]